MSTFKSSRNSRAGCPHPAVLFFVYLPFFRFSMYLYTPSSEENDIQLPFSTTIILPKNKFFDKMNGGLISKPPLFFTSYLNF